MLGLICKLSKTVKVILLIISEQGFILFMETDFYFHNVKLCQQPGVSGGVHFSTKPANKQAVFCRK